MDFKNILILGSSGQIGSALKDYLLKLDYNVIEFDIENDIVNQDLRIDGILDSILPNIDFCFNLAFDVGGSRYLKKYQHTYEFLENNMSLMLYTFRSLKKYNTPFIFSTTQMSNMSHSSYGTLKAIGEHYTKNIGGMVAKFWNVYGVEHDENKAHVITDFIKMAKSNGVINMMTNGEEVRQFLHVDDCCECLEILMKEYYNINRDEELNVTSFIDTKIVDVAKVICDYFNIKYIIGTDIDSVQLDKRNIANTNIYNYWKPKINLEDGIINIIDKMK
jgi:nucleoside-diphosphate-sugar epimerase